MAEQSSMHGRRLVGRGVVPHDVDLTVGLNALVDFRGNATKSARDAGVSTARGLHGGDIERGEEIARAVADVGPPFRLPDIHRRDRLRAA